MRNQVAVPFWKSQARTADVTQGIGKGGEKLEFHVSAVPRTF